MLFENVLLLVFAVQTGWNSVSAQRTLFAALRSMIETVESERALLLAVENYGVNRNEKLETIKRIYDKWEQLHYKTQTKLRKNKSDHVAKFKLIQRITRHWRKFKTNFLDKLKEKMELDSHYNNALIPQISDVRGFTRLLLVNADIYKKPLSVILAPKSPFVTIDEILELAFRIKHHSLGHNTYDSREKASDLALYALKEFGGTLKEAGVKLNRDRWDLLSSLTDELYESGLFNVGHSICKRIVELFPDDDEFSFKAGMFSERLSRASFQDEIEVDRHLEEEERLINDRDKFNWLCRHRELIQRTGPELKCYYFHKNPHMSYFARYKVEEVSHSPVIRMYHDVLHDGEIKLMQELASPILNIAKAFNPKDSDVDISEDRISNNAWLVDPDRVDLRNPMEAYLYRKLNQRMEDCTMLNKEGTEGIQVNNYGIGGHYLWHYDSLYYNADLDYYANDRVGTWMFYLNDVKEGGNTVFPRLNISIPPKKGSAVFWYNLHPSGLVDYRTLHGGCPILQGTKWVANLWVGEFPQAFIRRCLPGGDQETSSW